MPPGLSSMGVGSQSLKGAAIVGDARQSPRSPRQHGVASRFNVRSTRNSFRRPQIHPRAVGKLTSVTICRELRHSEQTIKSEHVGTDRRRYSALRSAPQATRAPPGLSSIGAGSQALEGAAIVGYARQSPGSLRQHGVASRFNVRSARNSFRRPQIHPRAVGKLTSVTICRELRHSDQIIQSEHGRTD